MTLRSSAHSASGLGRSLRAVPVQTWQARVSRPRSHRCRCAWRRACSAQAARVTQSAFGSAQQDVCQRWLSARTVVLSLVHIASANSLQPPATRVAFICAETRPHLRRDKLARICAGTAAVRGTHAGLSMPSSATRLLSAKRWRSTCTHTRTSVTRTPAHARARTRPETHTRNDGGGGTRKRAYARVVPVGCGLQ